MPKNAAISHSKRGMVLWVIVPGLDVNLLRNKTDIQVGRLATAELSIHVFMKEGTLFTIKVHAFPRAHHKAGIKD